MEECQQIREWRNAPDVLPMLRTGYKTEEEQKHFYINHVLNPLDHQYYAVIARGVLIGMGGLTYLSRLPGQAEISLILGPKWRGRGYGAAAVEALLQEAWRLGLTEVIGECYPTGALKFWSQQIQRHGSQSWHYDQGALHWTWYAPELAEHGYGAGV